MSSPALQTFIDSRAEFCQLQSFRKPAIYWNTRRASYGASEVSALFAKEGWCPSWLSEYSVGLDKVEGIREVRTDEWLDAAIHLEATIAQLYANKLGPEWIVERSGKEKFLFTSLKYPPLACTPDAFILPADPEVVRLVTYLGEFKAPFSLGVWKELPNYYRIQAMAQMLVMGVERCSVVALVHGVGIREFPVEFDRTLGREIVTRVQRFWDRYVVRREPLPIDGSEATSDALKLKYHGIEKDAKTFGEKDLSVFEEFAAAKGTVESRELAMQSDRDALEAARNKIRDLMGEAGSAQVIIGEKLVAKVSNRLVKATIVPSYPKGSYRNLRVTLIDKD